MKIGVSGAKGSFSEEAAREYAAKNGITDHTVQYLVSVENVLAALDGGSIELGIFPTENSTGGAVIESVEAMKKHSFTKKAEFSMNIRQNLLAREGTSAAD